MEPETTSSPAVLVPPLQGRKKCGNFCLYRHFRKERKLLVDADLRRAFLGAASDNNPAASRLGAAGLTNIRLDKPNYKQTEALCRSLRLWKK